MRSFYTQTGNADMSDRLQEIRERENRATRGPWVLANGFGPCADGLMRFERLTDEEFGPTVLESGGRDVAATREDAEFIAYARVDIPYLIELVENYEAYVLRVERERDEARSALASAKDLLAAAQRERDEAQDERKAALLRLEQWDMTYGPSALPNATRILREHEEATAIVTEVRKLRDGYVKSRASLVNDTLGAVVFDLDNVLAGHKVSSDGEEA